MKVLWICNQCVPQIAEKLNIPGSNKEGWIAGLFDAVIQSSDRFALAIAFPYEEDREFADEKHRVFAFAADISHPENYEERVTDRLRDIIESFQPDIVHIFGTEYGHSLSATKALNDPSKLLIGFQGVCGALAEAYLVGVDAEWIHKTTLRDLLKKDNLVLQQNKFKLRAEHEKEAICLAGYLAGRTRLDKEYAQKINPDAEYVVLNETMRSVFYTGEWEKDKAVSHRIFVSQCDYPIKGFHIMIKALAELKKKFPDAHIHVAGNTITGVGGIKKKLLISTYGKYLKHLMKKTGTENSIIFLGRLDAERMKEEYLSSSVFVLPSVMENSPNCLGEAMLLGTPCVASNVGGVSDICPSSDGWLYEDCDPDKLAMSIQQVFQDLEAGGRECINKSQKAKEDALARHSAKANYNSLLEIYTHIYDSQN